jgi:hypothetical protein
MAVYGVGPGGVSTITPVPRHSYTKIGILEVADGTTGVLAFKLPKYAVPIGVYTICTGANTTQTIKAGYTDGGDNLLTAFSPNSTGYATSGTATGTGVGVQITADTPVYLKASAALTTPVIVKVEYYIPPQGLTL